MDIVIPPCSWRDRLAAGLPGVSAPVGTRGDFDLNPDLPVPDPLIPASVLVPLVDHPEGPSILLTKRTTGLAAHSGQISFPGGRTELEDADSVATALREAHEEVALPPDRVEILGRLDTYIVRSGYAVVPVVGVIRPPVAFRPEPSEVAEIFEVPLDFFLSDGMPERHSRVFEGRDRFFYVFPYAHRYIWGATAGMLRNLREILERAWPS